jgi:DNA-directed RNA polymerase sigma subunit (sigma70/sigma32)
MAKAARTSGSAGNRSWSVVKALDGTRSITLLPRERVVLALRDRGSALSQIGEQLGVTKERVRQIEHQARRKQHALTTLSSQRGSRKPRRTG